MNDIEIVNIGGIEVPCPVSIGAINEFKDAASRLRTQIAESAEFDARPLRVQLQTLERIIAQVQTRLDANEREGENAIAADTPNGVMRGGTGFYYKKVDGFMVIVCEDCWEPIPNYRDCPQGLISPESDGDHGGNFVKRRKVFMEGKMSEWRPGKAVCIPCYYLAFARFYPGATIHVFDETLRDGKRPPVRTTAEPFEYVPEPKGPLPAEPILMETS